MMPTSVRFVCWNEGSTEGPLLRKESPVPRPKVPLISKRKTLEAALHIIDEEGLDSLS